MAVHFDLTGCLPDDLLFLIFSLLPIKSIARTAAVCKRWNHLFHSLKINPLKLDFSQQLPSFLELGSESGRRYMNEFVATVNLSLRLLGPNKLKSFKLTVDPIRHLPNIYTWVDCLVERGVEKLQLDYCLEFMNLFDGMLSDSNNIRRLPPCLFESRTITHLKITCSDFNIPNGFSGLKFLTQLHLFDVSINDEMLETMLTNCTAMQVLSLKACFKLSDVKIRGANLQLKSLALLDIFTAKLHVFAPNLQNFHFNGTSAPSDIITVPSLIDANVWACRGTYDYDFGFRPFHLLSMLRHVQILTLCSGIITDMTYEENPAILPLTFNNLSELQILLFKGLKDVMMLNGFLSLFVDIIFPSLEKLFIELDNRGFDISLCERRTFDCEVPNGVQFHQLKRVKITNFHGYTNEIVMVEFLLERSVGLEFMFLVAAADEDEGSSPSFQTCLSNALQQLLLFPMASVKAQIILLEYGEKCSFEAKHKSHALADPCRCEM